MSYRNPKLVLDRKYSNINKALTSMFDDIGDTAESFAKRKQDKQKKAEETINKRMSSFDKEEAAFRTLAADISDDIVSEEEKQSYSAQVEENLEMIRSNLAKELSNQDLTNSEILKYQSLATRDLNNFSNQLLQWQLATNEYMEAKDKKWNEEGALLPGKNNEAIEMIGGIMDDGKDNFHLFNRGGTDYKLGQGNWAIGTMEMQGEIGSPGSFPTMENVVMFDEIAKTKDGESFFNKTGGLNEKQLDQFKDTIDTFIKNKDERFVTDGKIDKEKLSTYLTNSPDGAKLVETMFNNPNDPDDKSNYIGYLRGKAMEEEITDLAAWDAAALDNRGILIDSLILDAYPFEQLDQMEIKTKEDKGDNDKETKESKFDSEGNFITSKPSSSSTTSGKTSSSSGKSPEELKKLVEDLKAERKKLKDEEKIKKTDEAISKLNERIKLLENS
tara:strand:+ start:203 stop:1534 length:1332 start_codon:yes stop_codon:yes gene_type:complete